MRYITEKALHHLCLARNVSWGSDEPSLENMIGPLTARNKLTGERVIPRNVAVYVGTVQAYGSPGSHYQVSALSHAHVKIAHDALCQFLEWFAGDAGLGSVAQRPPLC
jgi:hypothetical protein